MNTKQTRCSKMLCAVSLLALAFLVRPSAFAESKPRDKVFVPPLQGKDIKPSVLDALFDLVVVAVSRADVVNVVTIEDVRDQLAQEKRKDALGCSSVSCATELAGALGVRYLLSTRVKKLGGNLIVTMSLIDTVEQQSKTGQGKCADNESQYDQAVEAAVAEALGLVKHLLSPQSVRVNPTGESQNAKPISPAVQTASAARVEPGGGSDTIEWVYSRPAGLNDRSRFPNRSRRS